MSFRARMASSRFDKSGINRSKADQVRRKAVRATKTNSQDNLPALDGGGDHFTLAPRQDSLPPLVEPAPVDQMGRAAYSSSTAGDPTNLPDPKPRKKDGNLDKSWFTGPLFLQGVEATDVKQGALGDCYYVAALAAVAHRDPKAIEDAVKDNGDGTYTCRFYPKVGGAPKHVDVDGELYVNASGAPKYAKSEDAKEPDKMELWPAILEKGYAAFKGDFDEMGNGGKVSTVLQNLYGQKTKYVPIQERTLDNLWKFISEAKKGSWPMVALTFGKKHEDAKALYKGIKLYPSHAYSILDSRKENGQRYVTLRNPWGKSEPGNDGKNDGIFELTLEDFKKYYMDLVWFAGNSQDNPPVA